MTETSSRPLLLLGDCLDRLREMPDNSVDSVVTDPPYGLSFMGKKWDYDVPSEEIWRECLRVLKPGGHLLAFAGTRTQHRMAVRIEDAGFEIRDMIAWVYGSGFPKSLDVSKAIDKAAGEEREVTSIIDKGEMNKGAWKGEHGWKQIHERKDTPATDAARQWQGWGTALKPALEPITVARKPLGEKTVAANVLAHGTGAINVDRCRVAATDKAKFPAGVVSDTEAVFGGGQGRYANRARTADSCHDGRWPANLIHDGSEEVVGLFPETNKGTARTGKVGGQNGLYKNGHDPDHVGTWYGDGGSAARYFYCAKASKKDRDEGLDEFERSTLNMSGGRTQNTSKGDGTAEREIKPRANVHPTVKPTDLMRYLCRLVTPPEGIVLDPFMGSGSTGKAAVLEGFKFIGIERDEEYIKIAESRIAAVKSADAESA